MSYNLSLSNGTSVISGGLADGTADSTSTSLTLVGKNYSGYGKFLNENFLRLAENFANGTAPTQPLTGQIWYDTTQGVAKINFGTKTAPIWKTIAGQTAQSTQPGSTQSVIGDLWWDTSKNQLNAYAGSSTWVTVGPAFTSLTGTSGAISETITDNVGTAHVVVKFYISNQLIAILNKDTSFVPATTITGFATIKPGFNLNTTVSPALKYYGVAEDADKLGGTVAAGYLLVDGSRQMSGQLQVATNSGVTIGASSNFVLGVSSNTATITNTATSADVGVYVSVAGVATQALLVSGTNGLVTVAGSPTTSLGVATKGYVDTANTSLKAYVDGQVSALSSGSGGNSVFQANLVPTANLSYDLGSTTSWWNNIYGTAIHAKYADLAERFESDAVYTPGTVVELGGPAEITAVVEDLSDNVFGVISTQAAYVMNSGAGNDQTHPPIAVQGRVPVKVTGKIKKGDRLVSAGNGLARAASKSEVTPWNVIGRALESKLDTGLGTIEAVVKLNS